MFCEHCGTLLADDSAVCGHCGQTPRRAAPNMDQVIEEAIQEAERAELEALKPEETPAQENAEAVQPAVGSYRGRNLLVLSIIGLILSGSFYLSIPGVVLSSVALYKTVGLTGTQMGKRDQVRIANILSWIGLCFGAVVILAGMLLLVLAARAYSR